MDPAVPTFELVVQADQERGDLRSARLIQARSSIHPVLSWLMLILVGLSLGGLAYTVPRKKNIPHIIALLVVALLYSFVLTLIQSFDRPFSAILALEPTAMVRTAQDIDDDYVTTYHVTPPCDDQGRPL